MPPLLSFVLAAGRNKDVIFAPLRICQRSNWGGEDKFVCPEVFIAEKTP